jgi:transglutaminase-like putative cysteine protease
MSELKALLERAERAVHAVPLPPDGLDGLQRRRDRKRRNQRIAAGVVGIAVFVAALWVVTTGLPFNQSPMESVPGAAGNGPALDPFISINAQLSGGQPVDLFKVQTSDPQYWRLYTLDVFDGEEWRSSDPDGSVSGQTVTVPTVLPQPPGYAPPPNTGTRSFTFRIITDNFGSTHALPMAQTPEAITAGDLGDVTWDPGRGQAFVDGGRLDAGMQYTVRSRILVPTAKQLDQVIDLSEAQYGQWTELPADLDPRIEEIANDWTRDAVSDYDKVLAIQRHFHADGFTYSTDVDVADDADALLTFLMQTRTGFCQQYATAMAVLARELGIPARVAVGYQAGTLQDDGTYLVRSTDAHAWVEVFFEGYGWLQFEPTPGRGTHPNAETGTYLNPISATGP